MLNIPAKKQAELLSDNIEVKIDTKGGFALLQPQNLPFKYFVSGLWSLLERKAGKNKNK